MLKRPLAALATLVAVSALAGCADDSTDTADDAQATGPACTYTEDGRDAAKEVELPPENATVSGTVEATIATSAGDVVAELDADATPCTVNSFVSLAEQGYFDDTACHRLTTQGIFVLQCGDPTASGMGGPGYSYDDELSGEETYGPGTLAMANAGPNTNGSQFFIVYGDSPLPPSYTVFGQIDADSLEVVSAIAEKGTQSGGGDGAPKEKVTITAVETD
ncbi:peptidylprolyl isomerase [Nocardioides sp.]|uniref:peptidylprolyl isomerase n=1 Tax=Nocardioides sp. TaxID=35761 RepID=UPI00356174CF